MFGSGKKCQYGDGERATNTVAGQKVCPKHAGQLKRMGGQSEAQEGRPGKVATRRARNKK
jgi:hypothetical protein